MGYTLVFFRKIIPWQSIINKLSSFYHPGKGRKGLPLRTIFAILIVAKLRLLSDRSVVQQVKENRYIQY